MVVNPYASSVVRLARVTGTSPEGQKLEVIFLDTGDYGRDVQVVSPYAGTDFGFTGGIPSPEVEGHDENMGENDPDKRHILAVVACVQGLNLCLGFLYPQVTQMAFTKDEDKNRLIERHTSDFYRTVSDAGDMDMVHPGGSFIRIGSSGKPDKLEGRDFDKCWKIKRNASGSATITLSAEQPLSQGATITLSPNGDIDISGAGTIRMTAGDDVIITAGGTIRHEAPVVYEVTPTHITTGVHTDANGVHSG